MKWAVEPVLLACIVLLVIVFVWLDQWWTRNDPSVSIGQMLVQVLKLLTLYVGAASCLPEPQPGKAKIDLYAYYDGTRLLSFGALIVSMGLFVFYRGVFYGEPERWTLAALFWTLLYPAVYVVLILVRWRWLNILLLGGALAFYASTILGIRLEG